MYLTRCSLKILIWRLTTAMQIGKGNIFSIASVFILYLIVPSAATALIGMSKLQLVTLRDNQEKGQGRLCPGLNNLWLLWKKFKNQET